MDCTWRHWPPLLFSFKTTEPRCSVKLTCANYDGCQCKGTINLTTLFFFFINHDIIVFLVNPTHALKISQKMNPPLVTTCKFMLEDQIDIPFPATTCSFIINNNFLLNWDISFGKNEWTSGGYGGGIFCDFIYFLWDIFYPVLPKGETMMTILLQNKKSKLYFSQINCFSSNLKST